MPTSTVVITSDTGEGKEYRNKKDMEKVITEANETKWHQTEGGSQLYKNCFTTRLRRFGNDPEVQNVLDVTFVSPPDTSRATKYFLNACRTPHNLNIIKCETNISNRYNLDMASWKARQEST